MLARFGPMLIHNVVGITLFIYRPLDGPRDGDRRAGRYGGRFFRLAGHAGRRHRPGACGTGRNRMVILPFF
jgi:hypothetical protein